MTDPKRFSSLQAHAALLGFELHALRMEAEHWTFIATAGAVTQELPTLEQVERWLTGLSAAVEGAHA